MRAVPLSRWLIFFAIACGGCALDLATKRWVFDWLGMPGARGGICWLLSDVLGFQTSLNEGALFGFGPGFWPLFAFLSLAAAAAVCSWLFFAGAARDLVLTVALSCVMGGILGNLYDRLGLPGLRWNYDSALHHLGDPVHAVRDWILVMIGPWHWPNFNVADSMLVCGAALLVWHAFTVKPKPRPPQGAKSPAADSPAP
jgi:signal peptidase II